MPMLLGIAAGAVGLFRDPDDAIGALNTFVLYLAFPVLIVVGITDCDFSLPSEPAFYLVVPAVAVLLSGALAALRRLPAFRPHAGPIALTSLFANTAYVGLPVVEGVLGPEALGLGALAVAMVCHELPLHSRVSFARLVISGERPPNVIRRLVVVLVTIW